MQQTILTDDQAAAIWTGQTTSILDLEPEEKVEDKSPEGEKIKDKSPTDVIKDEDLNNVFVQDPEEENEEEEEELQSPGDLQEADDSKKQGDLSAGKKGRKPSDLVSLVTQMIKDEVLSGYVDDKGESIEIKTIDEAKDLIKANLEESRKTGKNEWWSDKLKEYSPQIQTILHYAEQGAQNATDLMGLLGSIKDIEDLGDIDMTTPQGHEMVVRETFKARGFKDVQVEKHVALLKDLGSDKLKEAAEEYLPELTEIRQEKVKKRLEEQESRRRDAENASKVYISTIRKTLEQDKIGEIKLKREDKALIYEALTQPKYTSLNGTPTNQFVKVLEDLQFGKNADYNHFLSIVHFAVDPKGFLGKLKETITTEVSSSTFRALKSSRTTTANASQSQEDTIQRKPGLKKSGFSNPFV